MRLWCDMHVRPPSPPHLPVTLCAPPPPCPTPGPANAGCPRPHTSRGWLPLHPHLPVEPAPPLHPLAYQHSLAAPAPPLGTPACQQSLAAPAPPHLPAQPGCPCTPPPTSTGPPLQTLAYQQSLAAPSWAPWILHLHLRVQVVVLHQSSHSSSWPGGGRYSPPPSCRDPWRPATPRAAAAGLRWAAAI